jgi:pantothenate kinase type III
VEQFSRRRVVTVATGGYARLIASQLPEIAVIHPHLTLEGLRIVGNLNNQEDPRLLGRALE